MQEGHSERADTSGPFSKRMDAREAACTTIHLGGHGAPSQDLLVIRCNHDTGEISLDPVRWGLIPYWCKDPKGGRKPINAKCETVRTLPTFRDAYQTAEVHSPGRCENAGAIIPQ